MTAPEPASVFAWGELGGEKPLRGVLRVLVASQHAGIVARDEGAWLAESYTRRGYDQTRISRHATADDAVAAVLASTWSWKLGARKTSAVHWSAEARKVAGPTA
jgi:hypothetical protein